MKRLTILGSTGSIGTSTLDIVRRHPQRFSVYALVAGQNVDVLIPQILEFRPKVVVVATGKVLASLIERLPSSGIAKSEWPEMACGEVARVVAATAGEVDFLISAIVGVAGMEATYEAIRLGKGVGLANKETLVAGGKLVMDAVRASGTELIPVDSEHNGLHQCLRAGLRREVSRLILTASGGPFRDTPKSDLANVTPDQALNHPTWKMGRRITVDSATLMNKGFEVIEACWLFNVPPSQVEVVVHPQSSVHAMVEYADGTVVAQVSTTDMRMPIQYALMYPERQASPVPRMDWSQAKTWTFSPPDMNKFPLLKLAYQAQETGGSATCTLNAADEVAVEAFLGGLISYPVIADTVEETLSRMAVRQPQSVREVLEIDRESRAVAHGFIEQRAGMGAGTPLARA